MAPRLRPVLFATLVAVSFGIGLVPVASATLPGFGGMVVGTTPGIVGTLSPLTGDLLGYLDVNPPGAFDVSAEAVILRLNGGATVEVGDIVVTNPVAGSGLASACASTCVPGSVIISAPGGAMVDLPANTLRYVDALPDYASGGPDGRYTIGEPIFIDNDGSGVAGTPDRLLVSGAGISGTVGGVLSGVQSETVWDEAAECIYVSADATIDGGDTLVSEDTGACVGSLPQTLSTIHITGADNTFTTLVDEAYISSDAVVNTGDYRVTTTAGGAAGTLVNCGNFGADADCTTALQATALANTKLTVSSRILTNTLDFTYFDVNGDGARDTGDKIVLDLDQNGYVTPLDIRFNSASQTFGNHPTFSEADTHMPLGLAVAPTIMWLDDADNTAEATEPIALDFGGDGFLSVGDICLSTSGGCTAGTQRIGTHSAATGTWDSAAANGPIALAYSDGNNNGHLDAGAGEMVFVHFGALPGTSTTLDLVIGSDTGSTGARATAGISLKAFGAGFSAFDTDKSGSWTVGDILALDQDANSLATIADVRVNAGIAPSGTGLSGFGKILKEGDADTMLLMLDPLETGTQFAFRDQLSGGYSADDPIMLLPRAGGACPFLGNDVVLSKGSSSLTSGAFVSSGYSGCEAIALPAAPAFGFTQVTYSTASKVYLNINGPAATAPDTTLSTGDVCIVPTSGTPGTRVGVAGGCTDSGSITHFAALYLRIVDLNGDGIAAGGEPVVLDADNDGLFTPGDVLLSGTTIAVPPAPTTTTTATTTASTTTTTTSATTTSSTGTTSSSTDTSTSSSSSSTSPPTIESVNRALADSLMVTRADGVNTLMWDLQPGVAGYQIFSADSPFVLLGEVPGNTSTFTDVDGGKDTAYVVTAFFNDLGKLTADLVNNGQIPGISGVPSGEQPPEGKRGFIPAPGLALALLALGAALVLVRRKL